MNDFLLFYTVLIHCRLFVIRHRIERLTLFQRRRENSNVASIYRRLVTSGWKSFIAITSARKTIDWHYPTNPLIPKICSRRWLVNFKISANPFLHELNSRITVSNFFSFPFTLFSSFFFFVLLLSFRLFSLSMILAPLERFVRPSSSPKTINFLSRSKHISRYYANTRKIVIILFDEETDIMESSLTFPDFPHTVISYAKRNRKRGMIFFLLQAWLWRRSIFVIFQIFQNLWISLVSAIPPVRNIWY